MSIPLSMDIIYIEPFNDTFEDIRIFINNLQITSFEGVFLDNFPAVTPFTNIWYNMNVTGFPSSKDLVGKLYFQFRNQGEDQEFVLSMDMDARVRASEDTKAADTFCKAVQYMFDWTEKWAKGVDLRDGQGEPFVIPEFLYSKAHFEAAFPQ